jgi:hypothetical protein
VIAELQRLALRMEALVCDVGYIVERQNRVAGMNSLTEYLRLIVAPTVEEFRRNPMSLRHCYLACVATYHAIDRAAEVSKTRVANLRQLWGRQSTEFKLVDVVAHDLKHIRASERGVRAGRIPISHALYGRAPLNTAMLNDAGQLESLRHLTFIVRDAVKFIHAEAERFNT